MEVLLFAAVDIAFVHIGTTGIALRLCIKIIDRLR